jgi:choline-sulfatase
LSRKSRRNAAASPPSKPFRKALPLGLGAILFLIAVLAGISVSRDDPKLAAPEDRDIILVTIDTLRADALGFAGNRNVQTPFLDRLARSSLVFTNAHAHNVVTLPSHVNILTGLLPYQHGVRENAGYVLDPAIKTIAPLLKERGFATAAFIGAAPLDARYGLTPGFDVYDDKYPQGKSLDFRIPERGAEEVLRAATAWWNQQPGKRFLWVHLFDPHAPYIPPPELRARYAKDPYLGEVAYVDSALEKFLGPLLEMESRPMLVLTSDHGEALGDHGELTHGLFAYEATLRVPLLIHEPGVVKPGVEPRAARHIDIVPTILKRVGVTVPADRLGGSLLDMQGPPRVTYFESLSASLNRGWAPLVGMIDQEHKYIELPIPELYDLAADPAEQNNRFPEPRRTVAHLRRLLAASAPAQLSTDRRPVSAEESARLLSLGYVSGTVAKKSYTTADDPKNLIEIDRMIHQTVQAYQLGSLKRALELATDVVRRQPDMAAGREMQAFMLQQAGQSDDAVATLRQAIARGIASDSMKSRLGLILSETGRAGEAVEILDDFAQTKDVEVLNAYGIALADLGRPPDAIRQFQRVLTIDPTNAVAYQNLGIVALRSGQLPTAQQYLARALELDDQLPLALNTLGVIYAQSGRDAEAIEVWSRAVALDGQLYDALFNLAVVAGRNQRWQITESALNRFIESAPPARYGRDIAAAKSMLAEINRRKN